ncbi:MAG TPA: heme o synthase [Chlamydiales bacterium]|nr:heme o synthase [Chlamydiales bacterium]
MIKTYYLLTKPGIIMGNAITTISGFFLASQGHFDLWLFIATLIGLPSVIASACVFNNYIDRHADAKMARTKNRALVKGLISGRSALLFAIFLGLFGFTILALYTNLLAVAIAALGFFVYVVLYSVWKYRSTYATLIGSISGAVPPVVGYCAASGRFDMGAALLFMILVLWQMPHFFSIAMYRFTDYTAASIPVLPVKKGIPTTKIHMLLYIIAFIIACLMLTVFGYTGYTYLIAASLLGLIWLLLCIKGFKADNDKVWGRQMFIFSLVLITVLCLMISLDVAPK